MDELPQAKSDSVSDVIGSFYGTTETHFDLSETFGAGSGRGRTLSLLDQVKTQGIT